MRIVFLIFLWFFFSFIVFGVDLDYLTNKILSTDSKDINLLVSNTLFSQSSRIPIVISNEVVFLYFQAKGKSPENVEIISVIDEKFSTNRMERIGNSDLFIFKTNLGSNWSIDYVFYVTFSEASKRLFTDQFNPRITFRRGVMMSKVVGNGFGGSSILVYDIEPKTSVSKLARRKLWIYLPPNYNTSKDSYPVLYIQDGQNVWDGQQLPFGGWKINTTIEKLLFENKIYPIIVVGIENSWERPKEYVGFSTFYGMITNDEQRKLAEENKVKSDAYMDFVVNEVMPFVEKNFRVKKGRDNTAIAGASFGAGVSLHIAFNHPDKFGMIGSISGGHYPVGSSQFQQKPYLVFDYLINEELPKTPIFKIFLSCGTTDIDAMFVEETEKMYNELKKRGWVEGKDLYYLISTNKGHNERTWAEQVPEMLLFFFSRK